MGARRRPRDGVLGPFPTEAAARGPPGVSDCVNPRIAGHTEEIASLMNDPTSPACFLMVSRNLQVWLALAARSEPV